MKYTITNFFRKKNVKLYTIVSVFLFAFVVSVATLATTNRKNSFALTSLTNTESKYNLYDLNDLTKQTNVNEDLFQNALKEIGATKSQPLYLFMKLADETIDPDKEAWLNALKHNINAASGNLLDIGWESKIGTQVSLSTWKSSGNCPTGYVSWSPDYNAAGTWFEPYFILNSDGSNANSYWSAWPSLIKHFYYMSKNKSAYSESQIGKWTNSYISNTGNELKYAEVANSLINSLTSSNILNKNWQNIVSKQVNSQTEWLWDKISKQVFNEGRAGDLSTQVGAWINQDNSHALWMEQFLDDQMNFIPLSQNQYATVSALRRTWLFPRDSSVGFPNFRDYSVDDNNLHSVIDLATPSRIFDRTITPLNPCFQDWPMSTNFNESTFNALTNWVTHGDITGLDKDNNVIPPSLYLQSANSVTLYDKDDKQLFKIDATTKDDKGKDVANEINLQDPTLAGHLSQATRYSFDVNTKVKWVDHDGKESNWNLSPRDFQRGWEAYWLSAVCGLNNNNYFLNMIGLDIKKTFEQGTNSTFEGKETDILDPNFDINQFQDNGNEKSTSFDIYLKKPFPLLLDVISKENFSPLPWQNPKVQNIATTEQKTQNTALNNKGAVAIDSKSGAIDVTKTDFSQIFGSGSNFNDMLDGYYSTGPYAFSNITANQILYIINKNYFEQNKFLADINNPDPKTYVNKAVLFYGSGNETIFYEKFLAGQLDYVKLLTMSKIMAAEQEPEIRDSETNELYNITPSKTAMSTYIMYTGKPYRMEGDKYVKQSNFTDSFYKMMEWWNDDRNVTLNDGTTLTRSMVSKIIRSGFFGLINFAELARIQNSSGSFEYSLLPYGIMNVNKKDANKNVVPQEFYHYIDSKPDGFPGAMLWTLQTYLNPLDKNQASSVVASDIRKRK